MIEFERVSKRYTNGYEGLKNVNFKIAKGEMAFLTGHSGAGKSTLLSLITGLQLPTSGKIIVNDLRLDKMPSWRLPQLRRSIGMIFQNPQLLHQYTVFDNVALPLKIAGYHYQEIGRRVRAALDKVGLGSKEKLYPPTLSGGEQQRVGIARAVVNKPAIILADEPTGNLDPLLATEIMTLFEQFNQVGVSILIASHDLALIRRLQHRIMTLHQGSMVSTGVRIDYEQQSLEKDRETTECP